MNDINNEKGTINRANKFSNLHGNTSYTYDFVQDENTKDSK